MFKRNKLPKWAKKSEWWEEIGYCPKCNEWSKTALIEYNRFGDSYIIIEFCPKCEYIFGDGVGGFEYPKIEKPYAIYVDDRGNFTRNMNQTTFKQIETLQLSLFNKIRIWLNKKIPYRGEIKNE